MENFYNHIEPLDELNNILKFYEKEHGWHLYDERTDEIELRKKQYTDAIEILNNHRISTNNALLHIVKAPKGTFCELYDKQCMGNICSASKDFTKCVYAQKKNAL